MKNQMKSLPLILQKHFIDMTLIVLLVSHGFHLNTIRIWSELRKILPLKFGHTQPHCGKYFRMAVDQRYVNFTHRNDDCQGHAIAQKTCTKS